MGPELTHVLDELLARSKDSGALSLDDIGDALGVMAVSQDEIDALVSSLESAGRHVTGPSGGGGERILYRVLEVARAVRAATGRAPGAQEIAENIGVPAQRVRHALALARVMAK